MKYTCQMWLGRPEKVRVVSTTRPPKSACEESSGGLAVYRNIMAQTTMPIPGSRFVTGITLRLLWYRRNSALGGSPGLGAFFRNPGPA